MARKTRAKRCFHCEKRCKNAQAVRAHQLHCPVRRLKAQAEAETRPRPVHNSIKGEDSASRRPGPESQENKFLLVETHERIQEVHRVVEHIAVSAQFFFQAAFSHVEGNTPPEDWVKLYDDLDTVDRDVEQMVCRLRLDRTLLFRMYPRLRAIRDTWLEYREHDYIEYAQRRRPESETDLNRYHAWLAESRKMIEDDRALLDDVVTKVKRLLVAAR